MKRNGFTLIELLAVIVILAIIALIATPIVLNIINNAKTSSNERSGELYVKAVENAIMKKQMNGTETVEDGEYTVQSDGSICIVSNNTCVDGTTITIDVERDSPTEGTITVSNGVVVSYNLVVSGTEVKKGDSSDDSTDTICTLVSGTSKTAGAKYSCKVNDTDTFYFYVLGDEDDNYINLIMDRNICSSGLADTDGSCYIEWLSDSDLEDLGIEKQCSELGSLGTSCRYEDKNQYGPLTALSYLNQATSTWINIDYNYGTLVDEAGIYSNISLSGYHARLPKISDIYDGTEAEFYSYLRPLDWQFYLNNENKYYLFDNLDEEDEDEGIHKDGLTHIDNIYGYWESSTYSGASISTWGISYNGDISRMSVDDTNGIRPVITLNKNQLN